MKKLFLPVFLLSTFLIQQNGSAQVMGNAQATDVADKNVLYNNPGHRTPPVDLSITPYSSSFSTLLEANVMINVRATSYTAIFSLTQYGKTVEEAETAMRARTDLFQALLQQRNSGIQFLFVDPVTMVPTYETEVENKKLSRTFNEVPTGFELKKNIHITFLEQNQINEIMSVAAKAEVYDLVKVDYNIEDKDAILRRLRNEALVILMEKKAVLEKAGLHARFVNIGEKQGAAAPGERYAQYTAFKAGMAPYYAINTKKDKPVQVQFNYADKQKTIYYDKIPDHQFDKVLNPVVNEPMVQIYFSLKGQFTVYDPEREAADKSYNEKIKQLQLREMELNIELKKKELFSPLKTVK